METINHEYYVSLDVAKLLKQAGFDWKVNTAYFMEYGGQFGCLDDTVVTHNAPTNSKITAPTLDVAQRWLREVKGYIVLVNYNEYLETFYYSICYTKNTNRYIDDRDDCRDTSFEEAQEAGIQKCLTILMDSKK